MYLFFDSAKNPLKNIECLPFVQERGDYLTTYALEEFNRDGKIELPQEE